jgi:hypothetical protein
MYVHISAKHDTAYGDANVWWGLFLMGLHACSWACMQICDGLVSHGLAKHDTTYGGANVWWSLLSGDCMFVHDLLECVERSACILPGRCVLIPTIHPALWMRSPMSTYCEYAGTTACWGTLTWEVELARSVYIHTVYNCILGDFPAKNNTVYTPDNCGSGQPYYLQS